MVQPAQVTDVTPDRAVRLFGPAASAAVAEELRRAGVSLRAGVAATVEDGALVLRPGADGSRARACTPCRACSAPRSRVPADELRLLLAGDDARVEGCVARGRRRRRPLAR